MSLRSARAAYLLGGWLIDATVLVVVYPVLGGVACGALIAVHNLAAGYWRPEILDWLRGPHRP